MNRIKNIARASHGYLYPDGRLVVSFSKRDKDAGEVSWVEIYEKFPIQTGDHDWRTIVGPKTRFKPGHAALACIAQVDESDNAAEDLANARLIACAPIMLNALKYAMLIHSCGISTKGCADCQPVQDAIAKAEGNS